MSKKRVVLIGGSGFVGSALANRLSDSECDILVPTRRANHARHLLVFPTLSVVEADIHDEATLTRLCAGADAVINLVGILHSRSGTPYGSDFAKNHVELPKKLLAACKTAHVPRFIHLSALGASADAPSEYLRSKAAGETVIHADGATLAWTILRPSVIFGRYDHFLNLFAHFARLFPLLLLVSAKTRFQPVYVEDLVNIIHHCLYFSDSDQKTFEVAGPTIYTLKELVEYVSKLVSDKPCRIIELPDSIAALLASLMSLAPDPVLTRDNLRSMQRDNIAFSQTQPFGLAPTPLESVVPQWLGKDMRAQYFPFRRLARRDYQHYA